MKIRPSLAAIGLMSMALVAGGLSPIADAAPAAPAVAAAAVSAPTTQPDRITLNPTADSQTTQTVTWRTSTEVTGAQLQFSPDTANPWGFKSTTVGANTQVIGSDLGYQQAFHSATITGLKPATTYLYRVGGAGKWSAWMPFTTSNPSARKTSLIAMGDIQTGIRDHWTRVAAAAAADRPNAKALITVGDQINTFNNDDQWHQLFEAAGNIPQRMIWIPAVGNHEYRSTDSGELTPQFRAQFELPLNGPTEFEHFKETVYYTDVDNVRVITMNSYYRIPLEPADEQRWLDAQAIWLEKVLKDNPREFTVVNMHYPIYSSSPDRGNPQLRATIGPILEKYSVDLVLQGHDHAYVSGQKDVDKDAKRKGPNRANGPIYVTSSSSNRQYPLRYTDWTKNGATPKTAFHSRSTYQLIDVEGKKMVYTAKDSTGLVVDQWVVEHKGKQHQKTVRHVTGIGVAPSS